MAASTNLTPEQRVERARKASAARHSIETYAKKVLQRAPELRQTSPELAALIGAAFAPARKGA